MTRTAPGFVPSPDQTAPDHAPNLYSPLDLPGGGRLANRFLKSAMSEVLAGPDGLPNTGHMRVYDRWAAGGTGLLVSGNVMVDPSALGEPGNLILEADTDLDPYKRLVAAVRDRPDAPEFWMQINHPGKQSPKFLTSEPVAPSAVPLGKGLEASFRPPRALRGDEIRALVDRFAITAELAGQAGFTGVQIHGAHGYLVSQFLSPHHNRREDEWGGSRENRRRFVVEIVRAVRQRLGDDFPVGIKMNSADFQRGGFGGDEAIDLIRVLSAEGISLFEISGGTYEAPAMTGAKQSTREREAYFLDFAESARGATDRPIAVTGGFRSVAAMERAVASGATDMVGLARGLCIDPELPRHAAEDPAYCIDIGHPGTGFRVLDKMFMLAVAYYETQIGRMAKNKHPDPRLSAWRTVLSNGLALGRAAFRRRRA
ncbi:NADH:flavin oxidoreductase/NADH oxidase family protein [Yunchengibacter salinarum]|uniref:NADH:flavin oxidoreductase/NADH oxidase family protein n=1 Tax=Yunchengibacter salinarum TaxID=3133399 RepID=UPI0035B595CB